MRFGNWSGDGFCAGLFDFGFGRKIQDLGGGFGFQPPGDERVYIAGELVDREQLLDALNLAKNDLDRSSDFIMNRDVTVGDKDLSIG